MIWLELNESAQVDLIKNQSFTRPQVIFKHSTRCSISSMAKSRLEKSTVPEGVDFHYLDLIRNRALSNQVAEEFKVWHESPQVLLIMNGVCTYHESHTGIRMDDLVTSISR